MFTLVFEDGDQRVMPYSKDIFDSVAYESFCRSHTYLHHLLYDIKQAKQ